MNARKPPAPAEAETGGERECDDAPVEVKGRLDYIEGLRGLAVGAVLIFHAAMWAGVSGTAANPLSWGGLGVDLFFVISGFCMAWPQYGDNGTLRPLAADAFYWRRFRRIWPPYAAAVAIALVVSLLMKELGGRGWWTATGQPMQTGAPDGVRSAVAQVATHLTFTHGFFPRYDRTIDGAFWSLATEAQFYVLLPLIVLVARRFGVAAAVAGMVAVSVAYVGIVHTVNAGFLDTFTGTDLVAFHLVEFGAGMLAAWLVRSQRRGIPGWVVLVCIALLLAAQVTTSIAPKPFLAAAAFGSLALWGARSAIGRRLLTFGPLRSLGRVSYSAYLIHGSVFVLIAIPLTHLGAGAGARTAVFMLAGLPLTLAASALLYRAVELPSVAWSHRRRSASVVPVGVAGPAE